MSTQPVTLDFSKAQPLAPQSSTSQPAVTLDFSKAQPLEGQPTTPPNSFSGQWNPKTQQWEDTEQNTVNTQVPAERFARSFNKGVTGAEDPSQLWNNLKSAAQSIASEPGGNLADPTAFGGKILSGMYAGMKQTWQRAQDEISKGNIHSAQGVLNYVNGFIHAAESGIPGIGPMLSDADKELGAGNIAGAAGTVAAAAAPFVAGAAGSAAGAGVPEVLPETAPAAAGSAQGGSSVTPKLVRGAATAVDYLNPPLKRPIVAGLNYLADKLEPEASPAPYATYDRSVLPDQSGPQRAQQLVNPVPQAPAQTPAAIPTAAERQAYLDQISAKRQGLGLKQVPDAAEPAQTTIPSEDDVAQGMGYKNAIQAQQRLGPDQWRKTYKKIAQPDTAPGTAAPSPAGSVSDSLTSADQPAQMQPSASAQGTARTAATPANLGNVIDAAVPPTGTTKALNMKTKAEVNFYVQKGDVDRAKAAIQKAATAANPEPAAERIQPEDFAWRAPGSPRPMTKAERLANNQEDTAIKQRLDWNLSKAGAQANLIKSRQFAAGSSADLTKVAGSDAFGAQGENRPSRWANYPLPNANMEANKLVGYDPRAVSQAVQAEPAETSAEQALHRPWGNALPSDEDLTDILKQSVDLAKKAKSAQTAK